MKMELQVEEEKRKCDSVKYTFTKRQNKSIEKVKSKSTHFSILFLCLKLAKI